MKIKLKKTQETSQLNINKKKKDKKWKQNKTQSKLKSQHTLMQNTTLDWKINISYNVTIF